MSPMVMEKKPPRRQTAGRHHAASYKCPLCAAYGHTPNKETIDAIRECRENKNLESQTLAEFLAELYS